MVGECEVIAGFKNLWCFGIQCKGHSRMFVILNCLALNNFSDLI